MTDTISPPERLIQRVTQQDIARELGVSQATVSLVMGGSNQARISPHLSQLIRETARRMNYRPNLAARQLVGKGSRMVGVIVGHPTDTCQALAAQAIAAGLFRRQYFAFACHGGRTPEELADCINQCASCGVDGIINLDPAISGHAPRAEMLADQFSCLVHAAPTHNGACSVVMDEAHGLRLAVHYLHERGHRRIAAAAPPTGCGHLVVNPLDGYKAEMASLGLDVEPGWIHEPEAYLPTRQTAAAAVEQWVAAGGVTAIIAGNDYWAIGLMQELRRRGLRVPDDVAVIGQGNQPAGQIHEPSLTTIDVRRVLLAKPLIEMLERLVSGPEIPSPERRLLIEPRLIVRQSA